MKSSMWTGGVLALILVIGWAGPGSAVDETVGEAASKETSLLLKAMIEQRLGQIDVARAAEPEKFEIIDRALPLFVRPILHTLGNRQRVDFLLRAPIDTELLHPDIRQFIGRYPAQFQELRTAAKEYLAGKVSALENDEGSHDVELDYGERLAEIEVACACPHNEFLGLVHAAGPHNLRDMPPLDPEYLMAWEAALLREDVSWEVKGQVLDIVIRFRNSESVPTLVAVRHAALEDEKRRVGNIRPGGTGGPPIAHRVMTYLTSQPTRASLLELAEIAKEAHDPAVIEQGVVPPGMYLIGAELNRSEEWKQLLDRAEAEGELAESVGWLREAMRLTARENTTGRD